VKVLPVPGGNDAISNVRIKPGGDVFSEAQAAGAGGLAFIRVREGGEIDTIGAIKDNLTEGKKAELLKRTGARPGTLLLFGAGETATVNKALDRVRQFLARELGLVRPDRDNDSWNFLWVVDFPMFEFNQDENRLEALHHPFCAPNSADLGADPAAWAQTLPTARAQAYDLVLNGLELGGGSLRIHDSALQRQVLQTIGLPHQDARHGRPAPRRPGLRRGPDRDAAGRRGVDPRHDRLPQDPAGPLLAHPGPRRCERAPAGGAACGQHLATRGGLSGKDLGVRTSGNPEAIPANLHRCLSRDAPLD
jgi:hypothetical protein